MTEASFFKNKGNNYNLFGVLFYPEIKNINNRKVVIFCDSIGSEKYYSHRVLVNFAKLLQKRGYFALLFDYYGNGDSEGDFESTNLDTYLSDIKAAIEFLTEKVKVEEICLLGLRLGSVFGSLLAAEEKRIKNLILWSPVIDVGKYLYDNLRSNLNIQVQIYKKINFNRDQLIEQIENNCSVEVEGYVISRDFYRSLSHINLKKVNMRSGPRTLLAEISPRAISSEISTLFEDNKECMRISIQNDPFWILRSTNQKYITKSDILFERTLDWLETA